ncbi:MAG: hypothetical protein UY10_C0047G0003 [Microgenomates group bacterium GW2011_GWA2_47_8]|nr:MAG: hypothetical protein UY10_C0047G0003 [Microgenomates group bacterium GW2011_GWA2_47_8]
MLTSVKYQALARDGFLFHNKDGMKRVLLILGLIFLLLGIPITVFIVGQRQELRQKAAPATTLSFSPSAASHLVGETFPLEVTLNSGENQVVAIELHITYDPTKLEAQTITNGPLFPNVLASGVVAPGTASITVGAPDAKSPVKGSGTAAVVHHHRGNRGFSRTDPTANLIRASHSCPDTASWKYADADNRKRIAGDNPRCTQNPHTGR